MEYDIGHESFNTALAKSVLTRLVFFLLSCQHRETNYLLSIRLNKETLGTKPWASSKKGLEENKFNFNFSLILALMGMSLLPVLTRSGFYNLKQQQQQQQLLLVYLF